MTRNHSKLLAQAAAQGLSDDKLDILADKLEHDLNNGQDNSDSDDPSDSDMELDPRTPSRDLLKTPEEPLTPPKFSKSAGVKGKHK
jgi:hypothetical protein